MTLVFSPHRFSPDSVPPARTLLMIGAQKAGTSFLHNLLVANGPFRPARVKEPHFFTSRRRGQMAYDTLFRMTSPLEWRIDSSTSYLHNPECAGRIASACGRESPVVALLRDPVERIRSAYLHLVKHGCETRPFAEVLRLQSASYAELRAEELDRARVALRQGRIALRAPRMGPRDMHDRLHDEPFWNFCYISNSCYSAQLAPFEAHFDRLLVLRFTDLRRNGPGTLSRVLRFLGLPVRPETVATVARNDTRLTTRRAMRGYMRNLRAEPASPDILTRAGLNGLAAVMQRSAQTPPPPEADRPWAALVAAQFARAARRISEPKP